MIHMLGVSAESEPPMARDRTPLGLQPAREQGRVGAVSKVVGLSPG